MPPMKGTTFLGWLRWLWQHGPRHWWYMSTNKWYREAQRIDLSFLDEYEDIQKMKTFRLKPNHPARKRLEEMFALMEERGIRFEFDQGTIFVIVDGERFHLRDVEFQTFEGSGIYELPPMMEYVILTDKE